VDGRPVGTGLGPAGLLAVDVPAGQHHLELRYRAPGVGVGQVAALAAAAVALVHAAVWSVAGLRRRRRRELPVSASHR
jgi:hypothetical protein